MKRAHNNTDRSESSHAILDKKSRIKKAKKITATIENNINKKPSQLKILELGTGSGYMAEFMSKKFKKVCSVDIVDERRVFDDFEFKQAESELIPYQADEFDVVISNHVVEHVPDQNLHISELKRVVKKDGHIYIATPNKYWITDPHYRLPFINYLPRQLSNWIIVTTKRGSKWDVYPVSPLWIRKKFSNLQVISVIPFMAKNQTSYKLDTGIRISTLLKLIPTTLLKGLEVVTPTMIYLIKKTD